MCDILNSYIRKIIISNIIMMFGILVLISSIIRLVDELRKIDNDSFSVFEIVSYIFLSFPRDLELLFPIVMLLGGLLGLGTLELHNEFIIMQIFGLSKYKISLSVMKAVIPVLLFGLISSEWILPSSENQIRVCCNHFYKNFRSFSNTGEFLWCVDVNHDFICIERIITYNELLGVILYHFNIERQLQSVFYVERAVFSKNIWVFFNVNKLDFSQLGKCIAQEKILSCEWSTVLTPDMLSIMCMYPYALSISKLFIYLKYLGAVGQNIKCYQLIFWNKILFPFFGFIMIVMALLFTFGPLSHKKISIRLCIGSVIGFVFYFFNQIFGILSIRYSISPVIGFTLFSLLFLMIGITIVRRYF